MAENKNTPLFSGLSFAYFTDSVDGAIKELWVENGGSVAYGITTATSTGKPSTDLYIQDSSGHNFELTWADQLDWKDVLVFAKEGDVGLDQRDDMILGFPLKQLDSQLIIFSSDWIHQCIEEGGIIPLRDWIVHAHPNLDVDFLEAHQPSRYTIFPASKTSPFECSNLPASSTDQIDTLSAGITRFTRPPIRSERRRSVSFAEPASIHVIVGKHLMKMKVERERVEKKMVEELLVVDAGEDEEDCERTGAKWDDSVMVTPTIKKPTLYSFVDNDLSALLHLDIKTIISSGLSGEHESAALGLTGVGKSCTAGLIKQNDGQEIKPVLLRPKTTNIINPPIEWYAYKSSKVTGGKFQFLMGGEGVGVFDLDGWTKGGMWCAEEKMTGSLRRSKEPQKAYCTETPQPNKENSSNVIHRYGTNAERKSER